MELHGRRVIYTDAEEVTEQNVLSILAEAIQVHEKNRAEIQYLYDYWRGKQPILEREKEVRPEINNKVVENRAAEIVSFFEGYTFGEPVQYVSRGRLDEGVSDWVNTLNNFVFSEDKQAKDKELADWMLVCGTAYRMILPDAGREEDEAPFEIFTLDPRSTFVVYWSGLGNKPVMAVHYVKLKSGETVYSVYTKNRYFEVWNTGTYIDMVSTPLPEAIKKDEPIFYGDIPIIEYPLGLARLGVFEIVLPLLDELNNLASNRMDAIEGIVQSILALKGVDIDSEQFNALKDQGGLLLPVDGDAFYLTADLNQSQTQTIVDYTYQAVLVITGMPNRSGYGSTSDTGTAVELRNGFTDAETRAKNIEQSYKRSEKKFLRLAIAFVNAYRGGDLRLSDIDIRFTRRNYENIQTKSQVLISMLQNDKIHPRLAFSHCGLFVDPELAYTQSMAYYEERKEEAAKELEQFQSEEDRTNQKNASDDESEEDGDGAE